MCAELINWFTGLLPCIFTPVCPEPQAAVRSGRLPALERSDLGVVEPEQREELVDKKVYRTMQIEEIDLSGDSRVAQEETAAIAPVGL